jgi:hypothetical protein
MTAARPANRSRRAPVDSSANSRENEFWGFSLAVYAAPGVTEECLGLQALRKQVKAVELEAERTKQTMLFSLADSRWNRVEHDAVSLALCCNLELLLSRQGCWGAADESNPIPYLTAATLALDRRG